MSEYFSKKFSGDYFLFFFLRVGIIFYFFFLRVGQIGTHGVKWFVK